MQIAVVGAKGLIGRELVRILLENGFDPDSLTLLDNESGRVEIEKQLFFIEKISDESFKEVHFSFFSVDEKMAKEFIPFARHHRSFVIDLSSAFRMHSHVPLIIPEINQEKISDRELIASPNCVVSIIATALFSLHLKAKIKRITASTYQAASGGGESLLKRLLSKEEDTSPSPIHRNLFLHESPRLDSGYCREELEIIQEMRKILGEEIEMGITCVRVPVERAHSISLSIEFEEDISAKAASQILSSAPGICYTEDPEKLHPFFAAKKELIYCGRIKDDLFRRNTLHLWVVADQLLKGTALNAFQIFQAVRENLSEMEPTCH